MNCNTKEYWNSVWSKWRHDDKNGYIEAVVDNTKSQEYWDEAFKNPKKKEKYSVQRAWWYAKKYDVKSVLDLGCGNGRLLYGIKRLLSDCELFGIDFSDTAIKRMKKEYDIDGAVMDVFDIRGLNRKFDMVIVNDVLEHIEDEKLFLRECFNVLNEGGYLYLGIPNNILGPEDTDEHLRKYTKESVIELMNNFKEFYTIEIIDIHIICIAQK